MDSLSSFQEKSDKYISILCEWNEKFNLTAIRDPDEIRIRHFEDSLMLLEAEDFIGKRVLDIGSGAGFPGLALALRCPDLHMTTLDATGKKVDFMRQVCQALSMENTACLHGRAEELAHQAEFRERFDLVLSRGVAGLAMLCEICLPFVKRGGRMLAMKEKPDIFNQVGLFGGEFESPFSYTLSNGLEHVALRVHKCKSTPKLYPRQWAQIKRGPPLP